MENLLNDLLAKDTTMGIGCDNMTAILVRLNVWKCDYLKLYPNVLLLIRLKTLKLVLCRITKFKFLFCSYYRNYLKNAFQENPYLCLFELVNCLCVVNLDHKHLVKFTHDVFNFITNGRSDAHIVPSINYNNGLLSIMRKQWNIKLRACLHQALVHLRLWNLLKYFSLQQMFNRVYTQQGQKMRILVNFHRQRHSHQGLHQAINRRLWCLRIRILQEGQQMRLGSKKLRLL